MAFCDFGLHDPFKRFLETLESMLPTDVFYDCSMSDHCSLGDKRNRTKIKDDCSNAAFEDVCLR